MVSPVAPTPWKRAVAVIIDSIIVMIPAGIIGAPLILFNSNLGTLVMWGIYLVGFGTRDAWPIAALNGASVGKKLLGLKAVRSDGSPCDYETSIKRNLPLMISVIGSLLAAAIGLVKIPVIGFIISIAAFVIGIVVFIVETFKVFTDEQGLRIGDLFASSRVTEPDAVHPTSDVVHYPPPPPQDQMGDPPPPPPPPA